MKKPDTSRNTSRRSFIKKSVVASVAASNLTMFSGLVNANIYNGGSSYGEFSSRNPCKAHGVTKSPKAFCEFIAKDGSVVRIFQCKPSNGEVIVGYCLQNKDKGQPELPSQCMGPNPTCIMID